MKNIVLIMAFLFIASCGSQPRNISKNEVQTTYDAILFIDSRISKEMRDQFRKYRDIDNVISLHHSLGRWLRNELELWDQENVLIKKSESDVLVFRSTDGLSDMILRGYWGYVIGKYGPLKCYLTSRCTGADNG